ncbi:MAG: hypothetical protein Q7R99_03165, partial [bacterium]|nr:hypothetical protein [bacterium]
PAPPSCTNACSANQKQCSTNGQYQLCGNYDTDSCLEWSTSYTCPTGQTCGGSGVCQSNCTNQCTTMSNWSCPTTNTYKICGDFNNDSCLEWSSPYTCDTGYTCDATNKTCSAVGDNPTTGTLTATKTTAQTNENVSFTVTGHDTNGLTKVCLLDGASQTPTCQNASTYTWTLAKQTPGTYFFYGYVYGKRPNGEQVERTTDPFFVKVVFQAPNQVCNNQCQTLGQWSCPSEGTYKICQDTNGDGCLEWSQNNNCQAGFYCSETQKTCLQPNDNPATIDLTVNKTTAQTGEHVNFTLQANDQDGVEKVCFIDNNFSAAPECIDCAGSTCQKNFTKTKQTPGFYIFSGYVVAKKAQGGTNTVSSNSVSVLFSTPPAVCSNDCSSVGQVECFGNGVRTCQSKANGCLAWSDLTNCGNDTYTEEYRCFNNNNTVQRKIIRKGCSGTSCYERQEWVDYDNCQTKGEICNPTLNRCNSQFLDISCFAAPSIAKRGELSWVVARVAGGVGPYQFSWTGDFSGTEQTVYKTFFTKGSYNAYLTVRAGEQTKSTTCQAQVSDEIAVYANHQGTGNIWVSNTTVYTGETFTISVFGADEDGVDEIQAYYQNNWHSQSVSGNSGTRNWQVTEYTPNRYLYCGKIVGRNLTGARDISYTNPRCIEVYVRNR